MNPPEIEDLKPVLARLRELYKDPDKEFIYTIAVIEPETNEVSFISTYKCGKCVADAITASIPEKEHKCGGEKIVTFNDKTEDKKWMN